ncbi:MAG: O-antigen ligase family protein, partial [Cyanobacteriota bacterium]
KNPDEITDRLLYIIKIITISFIAYLILAFVFVIIGISTIGFHHGRLWGDFLGFGHSFAIYLSYYLLLLIGLKYFMNTNIIPLEYKIYEKLVNFLILIFSMLIILQINKTALISLTLAILTFVIIGFFLGIKINLFEKIHTSLKFSRKELFKKTALFASLIILILLIIANYDSITIFINETINRVMLRFSTFTTLNSRTVLWEYFIEYWYDNLTITKILFGSGIDSSREVAFMLSAMLAGDIRMFSSPLVHVHNLYLEMFYDYGLVALLYFGSIIYILLDNIKLILSKTNNNIKLFSLLSLSIITFFLLFSLTEILRIPIAIILFSMLGFLESIKWSLIKNQEKI